MEAVGAAKEAASLWNAWNVGKIFSGTALCTEIHITNNSDEPIKYITSHIVYCELEVMEPADLPDNLLMPGQKFMFRYKKLSGLLDGSIGPSITHIWTTPAKENVMYRFDNPINGHPEGKCAVCPAGDSSEFSKKKLETNVWESRCRSLRATGKRFGEDGLKVTVTFERKAKKSKKGGDNPL